jgi:thiamine biosynthesis lipoprotein
MTGATTVSRDAAADADRWHERRFCAMGSEAHLVVRGGDGSAVEWAVAEVARLEALWSRFRPDSDVARCNAASAADVPMRVPARVHVAPETCELLTRAVSMWRSTDGRFDPTVLRALEANGYDETFERVRARKADVAVVSAPRGREPIRFSMPRAADGTSRAGAEAAPGCGGIVIDGAERCVTLPRGTTLDLGGIGKGYAADLVADGLVARGVVGACVALGGDVRAAGEGPDEGRWPVPVEDPLDESRAMFTHSLRNGAIVTSTVRFRQWIHLGSRRHHIIDPAAGAPARTGVVAVVVADAHAWRAEALAKAALVAGVDAGRALLERHGVEAWIVSERPVGIDE